MIDSSWQNFKTSNTTEPDCDANDTFGTASKTANTISITSADERKWVCFRVQNSAQAYSYVKQRIDVTAPTITATLTGDTLTASTTATDLASVPLWEHHEYVVTGVGVSGCKNLDVRWNKGSTIKYVDFGKSYCFRVSDTIGNTGYLRYAVGTPTLTLSASQSGVFVSAQANNLNPALAKNNQFGHDIALDGDRLVVGAWGDSGHSGTNTGAVYIFKRTGSTWTLEQKLADRVAGLDLDLKDEFGWSVDIDGDRIAVGARFDDGANNSTTNSGAVYIFKRTGTSWSLERKIEDGASGFTDLLVSDGFGWSVDLSSQRLAVGARYDDGHSGSNTGAVYIFKRTGTSWALEQTLEDKSSGFKRLEAGDSFGVSVYFAADRLAAGVPNSGLHHGAVYIFKRTGTTWALEQEISNNNLVTLAARDRFGRSLAMQGNRLAVGSHNQAEKADPDEWATESASASASGQGGAVYIFKRTGTTWALEQKIDNQTAGLSLGSNDDFGWSVDLNSNNDRLAIGSPLAAGNSGTNTGAAYVFKRTGTTWALEQERSDQATGLSVLKPGDRFGFNVSLDGDYLMVASRHDRGHSGLNTGAVYVFKKDGSNNWLDKLKLRDDSSILDNTWQNFKTTTTTSPNCSSASNSSFGSASAANNTVKLVSGDNNKWVCFRVKSSGNVYSYVKQQVTLGSVDPALVQDGNTISASGAGLSGFQYFDNGATDPTCSATSTQTWKTGSTATNLDDNDWVCFKAQNFLGVYGYAKLQVDLTAPTLTLTQNGSSVSVSGTNLSDFNYFNSGSTDPDCSASNTSASWTSGTLISGMTNNHYVCFKAKNNLGVYGYKEYKVNLTAPTLTLTQNGSSVIASGSGLSGFEYFDSGATNPDCDGDDTFTGTGKTASNLDDDDWVCFKAKNSLGVYGYAELQIDLTAPTITLTQNGSTVSASTTNLSDHKYFTASTDPTCDSTASWSTATSGTSVSSVADTHWVCFRAKNSIGVYGYVKHQVDLTAPEPTLTQNGTSVTASGTGLSDFSYFTSSTDPTCSSSYTSWSTATSGTSASNVADTHWVCFRAKNTHNIYGYAELQVDLDPPTLTLTQDGSTVTASGNSLTYFAYFTADTNPDCSASNTSWTGGDTKSSLEDDDWICFRARNPRGIYGYAELQVDLTVPTLTLTQNGTSVTASGTGLSDFSYFTSSTDPDCSASNTSATWTVGTSKSSLEDDDWICFKAKNSYNIYGYAELQVDLTAPTLALTQTDNSVTATGSNLNSFAYFTSDTDPDCSASNTTATWTSGVTASSLANGKWVCFRAANSKGVFGYAELQANLAAPVLTLTQSGSSVTASGTGTSDFSYFTSSSDPTCDSSYASWSTATSGTSVSSVADTHWVCFRAKNTYNIYGYAELQVDLTAPTITLTQNQNSVEASASAPAGSTIDSSSWAHSSSLASTSPTCSGVTYDSAGSSENTFNITSSDNGKHICFKVENNKGIVGYAKLTIDYDAPLVNIAQTLNVLDASSSSGDLPDTPTWQYKGPLDDDPDCSAQTGWSDGQSVSSAENGKWYCFRVADKAGNYGYAKHQVNLAAPTIIVFQDIKKFVASGTDLGDFSYFISNSDPDCRHDNSSATWTSGRQTTNLTAGQWVCFKAKNNLNVWGSIERQINIDASSFDFSQTQTKLSFSATETFTVNGKDVLKITQKERNSLVFTSLLSINANKNNWSWRKNHTFSTLQCDETNNSDFYNAHSNGTASVTINLNRTSDHTNYGWCIRLVDTVNSITYYYKYRTSLFKYVKQNSSTCSSSTTGLTGIRDTLDISSADNNKYICLSFENSRLTTGYDAYKLDFNSPAVSVAQDGSTLTASSTATDLPSSPVWKHTDAKTDDPTCSGLGDSDYSNTGNSVSSATDGKYYCFRVADKAGNHGLR